MINLNTPKRRVKVKITILKMLPIGPKKSKEFRKNKFMMIVAKYVTKEELCFAAIFVLTWHIWDVLDLRSYLKETIFVKIVWRKRPQRKSSNEEESRMDLNQFQIKLDLYQINSLIWMIKFLRKIISKQAKARESRNVRKNRK